jgi:hypothetical protein
MRPQYALWTLCLHAGLLVVASTHLSVVSWLWGNSSWTWDYFRYAYQRGWGYPYQSDYSLAVVLIYLAAYLAGIAGYGMARKHVSTIWNPVALVLSLLGLISFLLEASHWLWNHHLSWIAICPAASLILVAAVLFPLGKSASLTDH